MQIRGLQGGNGIYVSLESREAVAKAFLSQGDEQFSKHDYDQAEKSYRSALQSLPTTSDYSVDRAIILKSLSRACRMQDKLLVSLILNAQAEEHLDAKRQALEELFQVSTKHSAVRECPESENNDKLCVTAFLIGILVVLTVFFIALNLPVSSDRLPSNMPAASEFYRLRAAMPASSEFYHFPDLSHF